MKYNKEVFYGHLDSDDWSLYIAATDKGLCYVGSQNTDIVEMQNWFAAKRPKATLVEDWDKVSIYAGQLVEYLNGERKAFNLPVDVIGTEFQEAVWNVLQNVQYGETKTYTEIAEQIGKPSSVRAVGTAIGANPVLIVVPCHRVISKSGKQAGYRGGIPMKERLQGLESCKR